MLDTALKYFNEQYYKAERAKTLFLKSEIFKSFDESQMSQEVFKEAQDLYRSLVPEYHEDNELVLADFDALVPIWSR